MAGRSGEKPPLRAWQRMLSGRRLDLLDPSPLDVEIEDIALGLSRVARWNGQTRGPWSFSVAQHSLLVEEVVSLSRKNAPRKWRLAALLHDAPEYVVGDLISPFKAAVGFDYKALENRLMEVIQVRFGLVPAPGQEAREAIKRADRVAAYLEATQLAGFADAEARRFFGSPHPRCGAIKLKPLPPEAAEARFLDRFAELLEG